MADLGEGTLCPLLFLDQTEAQRAQKIFLGGTGPPLSKVLDDPPPHLKVWICHCYWFTYKEWSWKLKTVINIVA